tara:strand:- start:1249 stop:1887 length:639 start_codon:yes stop_codon:yes gene_type:complete
MKKKILTERRLRELAGLTEIQRTPSGAFVGPTGTLDLDAVDEPDEPADPDATQAPSTVPSATKEPEMSVSLAKKVGRELVDWFFSTPAADAAMEKAHSLIGDVGKKMQDAHHKLDVDDRRKDRAAQAEIQALSKIQNSDEYHEAEQLHGLAQALAGGVPPVVAKAQELRTARAVILDENGFTDAGRELLKVWNALDKGGLRPAAWASDVNIK